MAVSTMLREVAAVNYKVMGAAGNRFFTQRELTIWREGLLLTVSEGATPISGGGLVYRGFFQ